MPTSRIGNRVPGGGHRAAFGQVLNDVAPKLPGIVGWLRRSRRANNTTINGVKSFGPPSISTKDYTADWYGRVLHFGIREHAMGSILSGIVLHGPTRAFGGTFLQFSDYMRPAVRLASLMDIDTIYIWTHDSIGLGEDGPTHQPIEHLAALRAIRSCRWFARPTRTRPPTRGAPSSPVATGAARSVSSSPRQGVPVLEGTDSDGVARGGYVLGGGNPADDADVIIIATGSEVQLAVEAKKLLADRDIRAYVVSMPCVEWFESQPQEYRDSVLPPDVSRPGRGGGRGGAVLVQDRRRHR